MIKGKIEAMSGMAEIGYAPTRGARNFAV